MHDERYIDLPIDDTDPDNHEKHTVLRIFGTPNVVYGFDGSVIEIPDKLQDTLLTNCYIHAMLEFWWKVDSNGYSKFIFRPNSTVLMASLIHERS